MPVEVSKPLDEHPPRRPSSEHVAFLGHLSDASLVDSYRRATLVVMPTSRLEGFGLTAAEALASGAPVQATLVGALPELLEPVDPMLVAIDKARALWPPP